MSFYHTRITFKRHYNRFLYIHKLLRFECHYLDDRQGLSAYDKRSCVHQSLQNTDNIDNH